MKKIIMVISIFLFFISLFFSCENIVNNTKIYDPIKATDALYKLAQLFAEVIKENPAFIQKIKEEANKRFDGDRDVLFDTIKDLTV